MSTIASWVTASARTNTNTPREIWRVKPSRPRTPKVRRRLAAVLATAVSASSGGIGAGRAEGGTEREEEQRVGA